jgi:hypothetical protein
MRRMLGDVHLAGPGLAPGGALLVHDRLVAPAALLLGVGQVESLVGRKVGREPGRAPGVDAGQHLLAHAVEVVRLQGLVQVVLGLADDLPLAGGVLLPVEAL